MNEIAGIGKIDRKRLSAVFRETKGTISVQDVVGILQINPADAAKMLSRWAKKGWLARLKRGLYVRIPLESFTPDIPLEDRLDNRGSAFFALLYRGMERRGILGPDRAAVPHDRRFNDAKAEKPVSED